MCYKDAWDCSLKVTDIASQRHLPPSFGLSSTIFLHYPWRGCDKPGEVEFSHESFQFVWFFFSGPTKATTHSYICVMQPGDWCRGRERVSRGKKWKKEVEREEDTCERERKQRRKETQGCEWGLRVF